jgi:hypothetical protein
VDAEIIVLDELDAGDGAPRTGQIALTVGLPIDTTTGEALAVGSLSVRLLAIDGTTARALTLELEHARTQVSINLTDVPAGGPYTLVVSGLTAAATCTGRSLAFSVPVGLSVWVDEALVCLGDGGWSATI